MHEALPTLPHFEIMPMDAEILSRPVQTVEEHEFGTPRLAAEVRALEGWFNQLTEQGDEPVGLAAPQIGMDKRIVVAWTNAMEEDEKPRVVAMINPTVEPIGEEVGDRHEACFSSPDTMAIVTRFDKVKVTYRTVMGYERVETFDGFTARVLQHETDHLDGVRYPDLVLSGKAKHLSKFDIYNDDLYDAYKADPAAFAKENPYSYTEWMQDTGRPLTKRQKVALGLAKTTKLVSKY